jgi:hypothetical protein
MKRAETVCLPSTNQVLNFRYAKIVAKDAYSAALQCKKARKGGVSDSLLLGLGALGPSRSDKDCGQRQDGNR